MAEKVLCPWCGGEMEARAVWHGMEMHWCAWTRCTNEACGAEGPIVRGFEVKSEEAMEATYRATDRCIREAMEAARAAAMRRYAPMIKPMTWDEFERMTHPRLDGTEYPPVFVETAKAYSGRCGSWIIAKPYAIRVDMRYKPHHAFVDAHCVNLDAMAYGKTWRCWSRKPTDEERRAAEWEI